MISIILVVICGIDCSIETIIFELKYRIRIDIERLTQTLSLEEFNHKYD